MAGSGDILCYRFICGSSYRRILTYKTWEGAGSRLCNLVSLNHAQTNNNVKTSRIEARM